MYEQVPVKDFPAEDSGDRSDTLLSIGCCSKYAECSAARRCLNAIPEIASVCAYRKNLEDGQIFYGKNATWFDGKKYSELCVIMERFVECETVVAVLCYLRRMLLSSVIQYRSPDLESAVSSGLFDELPNVYAIQQFKLAALKRALSKDSSAKQEYLQVKKTKPDDIPERIFLSDWLLHHRRKLAFDMTSDLIHLQLPDNMRNLVFLWMDEHKLSLSSEIILPEKEDGRFLKTV